MAAYYNEFDPFAAAWLRELIRAGLIPDGDVDERSIKEVQPDDVRGYTQAHFFAGIGGWGHAARLAGWPDDRPLWTGSCPCQPFSVAGRGRGTDDERHLWPDFFRLIGAVRPPVVVGEQVAGSAGLGWFDGVASDLESSGYTSRAVDIPACAVDAPHRRQRLYWLAVADASGAGGGGFGGGLPAPEARVGGARQLDGCDADGFADGGRTVAVEHAESVGRGEGRPEHGVRSGWPAVAVSGGAGVGSVEHTDEPVLRREPSAGQQPEPQRDTRARAGGVGDAATPGEGWRGLRRPDEGGGADVEWPSGELAGPGGLDVGHTDQSRLEGWIGTIDGQRAGQRSAWASGSHWIAGHDGKARRVEPGIRLLAHGIPSRVAKLRGLGNAIVPPLAAEVLAAWLDVAP